MTKGTAERPLTETHVTIREAAELAGVSYTHMTRMINDGRMPAERFGPQIIIVPREAAEAYRRQRRTPAVERS